eukprot:162084-Heterocapsa_arctica.AAC.1
MGRWWSLFSACEDVEGEEVILLMVLVYVGMREKFWTSIWDSPLCKAPPPPEPVQERGGEDEEPAAAFAPAAVAPGGPTPRT